MPSATVTRCWLLVLFWQLLCQTALAADCSCCKAVNTSPQKVAECPCQETAECPCQETADCRCQESAPCAPAAFGSLRFAAARRAPRRRGIGRWLGRTDPLEMVSPIGRSPSPASLLAAAEGAYGEATQGEWRKSGDCVDDYFRAAMLSWRFLSAIGFDDPATGPPTRAWDLYHSSLARLLTTGQQFGRLDPRRGLLIGTPTGLRSVAIRYRGFPWQPSDFRQLTLVGQYREPMLSHIYRRPGLGVPVVVHRFRAGAKPPAERLVGRSRSFAATVVLRPAGPQLPRAPLGSRRPTLRAAPPPGLAVLELYDPLRTSCVDVAAQRGNRSRGGTCPPPRNVAAKEFAFTDPLQSATLWGGVGGGETRQIAMPFPPPRERLPQRVPLASDISAPAALALHSSEWQPVQDFLRPDTKTESTLIMVEPYQRGKIPLVFVHGLLSDPMTYLDIVNEIRADPQLIASYQIWGFGYPTGGPFLGSAARLRALLRTTIARRTAAGDDDPALHHTIIMGHSMGGLITKLQVTASGNVMWDQLANRPLDQMVLAEDVRQELAKRLFFTPLPFVDRVVLIATPHDGSPWAKRLVGRLAGKLVDFSARDDERYQKILRDNPGAIKPELAEGMPTSIDMLEQENPVLVAERQLRIDSRVKVHSIIGTGHRMLRDGPADGIVPVSSARHPDSVSEAYIAATHTTILRNIVTSREIKRILYAHLAESGCHSGPPMVAAQEQAVR